MGWARLDDSFHDHPKLIGLSLEALGLWTKCFTWAHRHHGSGPVLGFLPKGLPETFAGNRGRKLGNELVTHSLWDEVEQGWLIHDYEDYLPASEKPATANDIRKARSDAGKRGAEARWGKADAMQDDSKLLSDPDGKPMPPTRPDPSHEEKNTVQPPVERVPKPDVILAEFEQWWADYPRKQGKADALKAFRGARKKTTLERLISAVAEYKLAHIGVDKSKLKMAGGWLRDERWDDELIVVEAPEIPQSAFQSSQPSVAVPPRAGVGMCKRHRDYPLPCDRCREES